MRHATDLVLFPPGMATKDRPIVFMRADVARFAVRNEPAQHREKVLFLKNAAARFFDCRQALCPGVFPYGFANYPCRSDRVANIDGDKAIGRKVFRSVRRPGIERQASPQEGVCQLLGEVMQSDVIFHCKMVAKGRERFRLVV
ncbi:MAG: hypothetical protein Q8J60_05125, partial [Thiobacillus sp.]|nr:hypothetical protein [Thiobacillus sp.]